MNTQALRNVSLENGIQFREGRLEGFPVLPDVKYFQVKKLDASSLNLRPFAIFIRLLIENGVIPEFQPNTKTRALRYIVEEYSPNKLRCMPKLSSLLQKKEQISGWKTSDLQAVFDLLALKN